MLAVRAKYRLCELFGIPVYVEFSFLLLLAIFVFNAGSFVYGLAFALMLAVSVVFHEFAHSLTARAFGYHTRDITISLLGGCASLIALPRKGWQEFLTAVAGPLSSFALSVALLVALPHVPEGSVLSPVVAYGFYMNFWLGLFNLLPGFPLDGGRVFRSVMLAFTSRAKATWIAMWVGRIVAVLLALSGLHAMMNGGSFAFIRILIAWMIWREGYREYLLERAVSDWREWTQDDFRAKVSPPPYERD